MKKKEYINETKIKLIHSPECIATDKKMEEEQKEWIAKWPNYCRNCKGWGGFMSHYDPSPSGVSLSSGYMEDFDTCIVCADNFLCSRCMTKNPAWEEGNETPCINCGWDPYYPDALPPDPSGPCSCELEYEKRLQEEWADHKRSEYQDMIDNMKG